MFTGIVQAIGIVADVESRGDDRRLGVRAEAGALEGLALGESVCVSGVCLSVAAILPSVFQADLSCETLSRTTLGALRGGERVNLERAVTASGRLGGHIVSGHVDGVGTVIGRRPIGRSVTLRIEAPAELARYVAAKGSICVDGVSLTVNAVAAAVFDVNIIPHTLAHTTLGALAPGDRVNLEVDLIARYLERLLGAVEPAAAGVTPELLARHGFLSEPGSS